MLGTDADLSDVTPAAVVRFVLEPVTPPGGDPDRSAADRAASDGGVADDGA